MGTKLHVKNGDEVYVLTGKDAGKTGKILEVHTKSDRVTVAGVNIVKKHRKPRPPAEPEGGIKEVPAPIHVSNVKLVTKAKTKKTKAKKAEAKTEAKPKAKKSEPKAEAKAETKKTEAKAAKKTTKKKAAKTKKKAAKKKKDD